MKRLYYSTTTFPFKSVVEDYLNHTNLPLIHEDHSFKETLIRGTDQAQPLHRKLYDAMDEDRNQTLVKLYKKFIKEVIQPLYKQEIVFQRFPTFRVHQPFNIAVFGWHRDRDYNHNPKEINYYLPITKAFATNTFWHETKDGKGDYQPLEADYGQAVEWDGANCRHGNKPNATGQTRISFDFRVLPRVAYDAVAPKKSITQGTSLKVGAYFDTLK